MDRFMKIAVEEAIKGVKAGDGGPFGAVIVRKGKVIARAHNNVVGRKDPTAHAEMDAIRAASKKLKRFDLSGCELYTNCEPCPMCLAAIYWARIGKIRFGCTRHDAHSIGFDDRNFYDIIEGKAKKSRVKTENIDRAECLVPFKLWKAKKGKKIY
jgi:guanine deaminase